MDALELIQLGRQLTKIGEEALRGSRQQTLPNGPSLVLREAFAHRDSSISEIAQRTALPQSYVSESVAALAQQGMLETRVDPADRRRTLVRVTAQHRRTVARKAATSIDAALARALADPDQAAEVTQALETLRAQLRLAALGPILEQLHAARRTDA
jgi:DNA-binding MarR family transcriptional regulator